MLERSLRDWTVRVVVVTLCATLFLAVVGIIVLMWRGTNVAAPVSIAVATQWGALAAGVRELMKETKA